MNCVDLVTAIMMQYNAYHPLYWWVRSLSYCVELVTAITFALKPSILGSNLTSRMRQHDDYVMLKYQDTIGGRIQRINREYMSTRLQKHASDA